MGDRAPHVARGEPLVERQAGGERHQGLRWGGAHPAAPRASLGAALASRPGLDAEAEQAHEAFGVLVAEGVGGVVGREVVDVEPEPGCAGRRPRPRPRG